MKNILLYIDPGVGSLIFQALLSGFLSFLVFFKQISSIIKKIFKNKDSNNAL